ncbi:hypothetical protein COL91_13800 [Bacillus pseudomycoides]|nr:hypothetical protein COO02_04065 [Bacillus pseudomycoides]PEI95710.1 hypothetical protein CN679_03090 [Bacillus pseudomycoides]PGA90670.1 hypothetical protein COL91_13800 [Bacillus pseudomycoides]PHF47264.1 hypothetical protein COF72_11415 [Bacillus pseudomycoides]
MPFYIKKSSGTIKNHSFCQFTFTHEFKSIEHFKQELATYIVYYNHKRIKTTSWGHFKEIGFFLVEIYLACSGHIFLRITEEYIENAT